MTKLRHTETVVIANPKLPVPPKIKMINLVWARNEPTLLPMLAALTAELVIEKTYVAKELTDELLLRGLDQCLGNIPLKRTSHADFKLRCQTSQTIIHTNETTPYTNILLTTKIPF